MIGEGRSESGGGYSFIFNQLKTLIHSLTFFRNTTRHGRVSGSRIGRARGVALIHSIEGELVSEVTLREHALTPQRGGRAALRTPPLDPN